MARVIYGKPIAEKILHQTAKEVDLLKKSGITPVLAVILVGDDKPSHLYVRKKQVAAEKIGIKVIVKKFPKTASKNDVMAEMRIIQKKQKLAGLIVQLPLPSHLQQRDILNAVSPDIDVDCLTELNMGKIALGTEYILPPTAGAVMKIFEHFKIGIKGENATIIGTGSLVGKPLAIIMMNLGATVTTCNSKTVNLKEKTERADIIISGVGKKEILKGDMVKKGAVVIDAGIEFVDNVMRGDADFNEVKKRASYITPTPGGIGPITVAMLLYNTVICAKKNFRRKG